MTDHTIPQPAGDERATEASTREFRWRAAGRLPLQRKGLTWLSGVWILAGVEILVALWLRSVLPWSVDHFGLVALEPLPLASLAWIFCLVNLLVIVGLWLSWRGRRRHNGRHPIPYLAAALVLVATATLMVTLAPHFEGDPIERREFVLDYRPPPKP